ncbi:MAG: dihydroorotate dehydrogenase (quinone), partial [Anaerolineales bacterium]|nr:dihydroorotate dehydrogenase (quinone) [Anaerolineales bacterium]
MSRPASLDFYPFLRPLLFRFDPESAHRRTLGLLRSLGRSRAGRSIVRSLAGPASKGDGVDCLGLHFPNRLGLAAGYDKDGAALR